MNEIRNNKQSFLGNTDSIAAGEKRHAAARYSRYAYQSAPSTPQSRRGSATNQAFRQSLRKIPATSRSSAFHTVFRSFKFKATALSVLIGALLLFVIWFGLDMGTRFIPLSHASQGGSSSVVSTPRSEWTKGSVPSLYQTDSEWASETHNGTETLGESGCGPTCLSMVYVALTGKTDYDPKAMFHFAHENGYMSSEGIQWTFFTEGAQKLGLFGEELPADEWSIREKLVSGSPVICSMGPGDFTTSGHIIVLVGIDQNHKLIVHDPNSPERSAKAWDFDTVLGQCRNLWSLSAA